MDSDGKGAGKVERSCIVSREKAAPEDLIRFVLGPDDTVVPDIRRRLPGRGVWVGAERARLETAVRKNLFSRALKHNVRVAGDLPDLVDRLLAEDVLGALGLARKAGQAIAGFDQVDKAARGGKLAIVFHAADGAEDGARKIAAALRGGNDGVPVVREFTSQQLSLALGRPNVIHAAVPAGRMGATIAEKALRLARYRGHMQEAAGAQSALLAH